MTDIDFDELDKAVNSLMGTVAPKDDDSDEPKQKTLNINTTLKPDEKPSYEKIEQVAQGIGSETLIGRGERTTIEALGSKLATSEMPIAELDTLAATHDSKTPLEVAVPIAAPVSIPARLATPATRRPSNGRFMDVVHPSSDMRAPAASLPVAAQKSSVISSPVANIVEPAPISIPETSGVVEAEVIETPVPTLPAPIAETQPEISAPIASTTLDTTLATPFLADAKVEKRPLGEPAAAPMETETIPSVRDDAGAAIAPEVVSEVKLNAIETSSGTELTAPETNIEAAPEVVSAATPSTVSKEDVSSNTAVREVESGDTGQLSGGSIAPQYKEKTEATPQTGGAIYDVKDYHKPLAHPAKQKSGWGVVIIIVVIIVVSALLAGGAYFALNMGA